MSNRFWVGNGGDWGDTAHWSTTSGGSGGASVPGISDNAILDASSFTLDNQRITKTSTVSINNIDASAATHSPHLFDESDTATYDNHVGVFGDTFNLVGITTARMWVSFVPIFTATTVSPGSNSFSDISVGGANGILILSSALSLSGGLSIISAGLTTFTTGGLAITTHDLTISGSSVRVNVDNSTITIGGTLSIDPGSIVSSNGTIWILANNSTAVIDGTSSLISLLGTSPAAPLTLTNNSGSEITITNSKLSSTLLNGTSGFRLVDIIENGGGNDWGGGGGGPATPPKFYYVKKPPTYIAAP